MDKEKNKNVIEMKNIKKVYRMGSNELKALDDINFNIKKGEFISIVGPSGAGKSTLMNIIGCLDVATDGDYILDGVNTTKCNDDDLSQIRNQKIGFVFQSYNLLPRLNVIENVELPLLYLGIEEDEIKVKSLEALKRVGLDNYLKYRPSELSGGQKQRVAIARAIVTEPEIILADEPTGALDSKTGKEVLNILKELNKEGNTIVLITHDKDIAIQAKRMIVVKDGKIDSDRLI